MRCPSVGEILDVLRSAPGDGQPVPLSPHLTECARCSGERAWLERVLAATAGGPFRSPRSRCWSAPSRSCECLHPLCRAGCRDAQEARVVVYH